MKYTIAIILILLFAIGVGLYLGISISDETVVAEVKPEIVYVDINKIMSAYPGFATVDEVNVALNRLLVYDNNVRNNISSACIRNIDINYSIGEDNSYIELLQLLEEEYEQVSQIALQELEAQKQAALDLRVVDMRESLLRNTSLRADSRVYSIRQDSRRRIRNISDQIKTDQLNAELRLAALEARRTSIIKEPDLEDKITKAKSDLDAIKNSYNERVAEVNDWARNEIELVRKETMDNLNAQIASYVETEGQRISASINNTKERMQSQIEDNSVYRNDDLFVSADVLELGNVQLDGSKAVLNISKEALKNRMRKDVNRAVTVLAAKEGLEVSFDRNNDFRDATDYFAEKLQNLFSIN